MCSFGILATRAPRAGSGAADGAAGRDGAEITEHLLMDTSLEEEGLLATTFAVLLDDLLVRDRHLLGSQTQNHVIHLLSGSERGNNFG